MKTFNLQFTFLLAIGATLAVVNTQLIASGEAAKLRILRMPDGRRIGLIGETERRPAPTLLLLEGDLETATRVPLHVEVGRILSQRGILSVMMDEPCKGESRRSDEPAALAGWRGRVDQKQDFVGEFILEAKSVLNFIVSEGYADPGAIGAAGTGSGAFLSFHLAAVDPRIRFIGAIAPVVELMALREFHGLTDVGRAEALSLAHLAPKLAWRPAWVSIGNNDGRLDTDRVIAFARSLVVAAAHGEKRDTGIPIELVVNSSEGHRSTIHDHELMAAWLFQQFEQTKLQSYPKK